MTMKTVQYALVYANSGEPACSSHQDDSESPLIAPTLEGLVTQMSDWCDTTTDYVLDHLKGATLFDPLTDPEQQFKIVRQVVETLDLNAEDLAELERLRKPSLRGRRAVDDEVDD